MGDEVSLYLVRKRKGCLWIGLGERAHSLSVFACLSRFDDSTWLILPVVICLSQRLSHARVSINKLYCETANGSLNQL